MTKLAETCFCWDGLTWQKLANPVCGTLGFEPGRACGLRKSRFGNLQVSLGRHLGFSSSCSTSDGCEKISQLNISQVS